MTKPNMSARARVTVTLEIDVRSSWGADCTIAQVHKQASEEAIGKIRNAFPGENGTGIRVIDAVPTAILAEAVHSRKS